MWQGLSRLAALIAILGLSVPVARADMKVLDSNVSRYPRDLVVAGNVIEDLRPGEWVRVLILEMNATKVFGDPFRGRQGLGTRGPRHD
jgi:hypothetical protein